MSFNVRTPFQCSPTASCTSGTSGGEHRSNLLFIVWQHYTHALCDAPSNAEYIRIKGCIYTTEITSWRITRPSSNNTGPWTVPWSAMEQGPVVSCGSTGYLFNVQPGSSRRRPPSRSPLGNYGASRYPQEKYGASCHAWINAETRY